VHPHPQGGEKKLRRNLQGKFVNAPSAVHQMHYPSTTRVNFRTFLERGEIERWEWFI